VIGLCGSRPMGGSDPLLVISGRMLLHPETRLPDFPRASPLAVIPSAFGGTGRRQSIPASRQNASRDETSHRERGWRRVIWDGLWKNQQNRIASGSNAWAEEDPSWGEGSRFILTKAKQQASLRERVVWHGTEAFKTWRPRGGLPLPPFSLSPLPRLPYHNFVDCSSRIPSFAYIHSFCLSIRHTTLHPFQSLVFVTPVVDHQNAFLRCHRPRACDRRLRPDRGFQCHHQAHERREGPGWLDLRDRLAARPRKVHWPDHHQPRRRRHPAEPRPYRDPCQ